jgi:hypothetical protein
MENSNILKNQETEKTMGCVSEFTKSNKYLFVTGSYRSGTTLLHHLLDGHPNLLSFPVENCIFRDYLYYKIFPHPEARNLNTLTVWLKTKNINKILGVVTSNDKLSLPLDKSIVLTGSTGNQVVETSFDRSIFCTSFEKILSDIGRGKETFSEVDIFIAYNAAYFMSLGIKDYGERNYFVNKCPEKGHCIKYYLHNFPDSKVIHIIRDPRACMASHKGTLTKKDFLSYRLFFHLISFVNDSLKNSTEYSMNDRVHCMQYENLVTSPEKEMKAVAEFLEIPFDGCLMRPTILGKSWKSNTSIDPEKKSDTKVYLSNIFKFKEKLNNLEIQCIETMCKEAMINSGYDVIHEAACIGKLKVFYLIRSFLNRIKRKLLRKLQS